MTWRTSTSVFSLAYHKLTFFFRIDIGPRFDEHLDHIPVASVGSFR